MEKAELIAILAAIGSLDPQLHPDTTQEGLVKWAAALVEESEHKVEEQRQDAAKERF